MGISLWLVPATAQMDIMKSSLPRRPSIDPPRSPSSYPVFLPHITLATVPLSDPGIPDVLLAAIPEHLEQPIRANFQSLCVGNHYFRSVLIDVEPTRELVDLQGQITANLRHRGLEPSAVRFPHMSLCYIADEDENHRERTALALRDAGVVCETGGDAQTVSLLCGNVSLSGFDGAEIWVVKCEGPVESWEVDERRVKLIPRVDASTG